MTQDLVTWFRKHEWVGVTLIALIFVLIRIPGLSQPLHQDEYKWPMIVNPTYVSNVQIPHPPLGEFIYRTAGKLVGFNVHFRFVPLLFGTVNIFLLYYLLRKTSGKNVALVACVLFTLSYFSILASLMVDTDGQIMPFFLLLALIGYSQAWTALGRTRLVWILLLVLACVLGFFVKVSFVLAIGAIAADFLWEKKSQMDTRTVFKYIGIAVATVLGLGLLLVLSQYIFKFFNLSQAFTYWEHFANIHRNWFQTGIETVKALLYTSPFLVLVPFLLPKSKMKEVRPFLFFIFFGLMFYIVLFDFSIGALDRYMQFLIIPLCAISAVVIVSIFKSESSKRNTERLLLGSLVALVLLLLAGITYTVPSLHPKSEWISRVFSFKWNFLYPFSGGSGPMGFYMSFLVMALAWIISGLLVVVAYFKPSMRKAILLFLIPIALVYNGLFAEEYLFGHVYGSAPKLLSHVVTFIQNDPDIHHVTVYNDNGGYEIQQTGKYRKRLYTDPAFNLNDKVTSLNMYKEHYLEINIPRIDPTSVYRKYLDSCNIIYKDTDHYISATVYDCRNAPDVSVDNEVTGN